MRVEVKDPKALSSQELKRTLSVLAPHNGRQVIGREILKRRIL